MEEARRRNARVPGCKVFFRLPKNHFFAGTVGRFAKRPYPPDPLISRYFPTGLCLTRKPIRGGGGASLPQSCFLSQPFWSRSCRLAKFFAEDPEVFAAVWDQLQGELQPEGELETFLAGRIIGSIWRMNRVMRIEAGLFNEPEYRSSGGPKNIGEIFRLERHEGSNAFSNLFRYETTVDLAFHRALHSLRLVQAARKKLGADPVAEWRELAGNSADYERNPIVREASREAGLPPNFHGLALPPAGEAGAGAGFRGDSESPRTDDPSAGGVAAD